jgi:hypothetical protein
MTGIQITGIRKGDGFFPASAVFLEDIRAIPEGREVSLTIVQNRNPSQHRWFWAMLSEVVKSGAWDGDAETLLDWLKIAVGHVTTVIDKRSGKTFFVLKSISFTSLDQTRFHRFVRRCEFVLAERLGVDIGELRKRTRQSAGADAEPDWGEPDENVHTTALQTAPAAPDVVTTALQASTPLPEPLDARLAAFALQVSAPPDMAAVDALWAELKHTPEVKDLYREAPDAVRKIVGAARKLDGERFKAAVNAIIDATCVPQSEAA